MLKLIKSPEQLRAFIIVTGGPEFFKYFKENHKVRQDIIDTSTSEIIVQKCFSTQFWLSQSRIAKIIVNGEYALINIKTDVIIRNLINKNLDCGIFVRWDLVEANGKL